MKLSNEIILNSTTKLGEIAQKQFPVKVSYAIAKNINKLEAELKIYNGERQKLIEKYSIKDETGKTVVGENNQITIQKEFLDDWNKDIKDLLAIENEVDIHKFKIDELNGFNMSPTELILIDYMIED